MSTDWSFHFSLKLLFHNIIGNKEQSEFSNWLLSLSYMHLISLYIFNGLIVHVWDCFKKTLLLLTHYWDLIFKTLYVHTLKLQELKQLDTILPTLQQHCPGVCIYGRWLYAWGWKLITRKPEGLGWRRSFYPQRLYNQSSRANLQLKMRVVGFHAPILFSLQVALKRRLELQTEIPKIHLCLL